MKQTMYAILCPCSDTPLICGLFTSKQDAIDFNEEIGCSVVHEIREVEVEIEL